MLAIGELFNELYGCVGKLAERPSQLYETFDEHCLDFPAGLFHPRSEILITFLIRGVKVSRFF
jgi:hypothetical protein